MNTEFDVVIIGGGIAGLTAAGRASQAGLRVAVLERGTDENYACNSRYSGGIDIVQRRYRPWSFCLQRVCRLIVRTGYGTVIRT
ncbi:MAG: FAD-dependent oxidoreductase [Betaproteobacteria bacterium]|nr:FAD-dependent oxidoreductase [Betaproteobacteria bacterium]